MSFAEDITAQSSSRTQTAKIRTAKTTKTANGTTAGFAAFIRPRLKPCVNGLGYRIAGRPTRTPTAKYATTGYSISHVTNGPITMRYLKARFLIICETS